MYSAIVLTRPLLLATENLREKCKRLLLFMVSFARVALPLFENAQMKKRIECQKNWPFNFFKASIIWSQDFRIKCMLILMMMKMKQRDWREMRNFLDHFPLYSPYWGRRARRSSKYKYRATINIETLIRNLVATKKTYYLQIIAMLIETKWE